MADINELIARMKAAAQELNGETWHYARPSIYGRGYIINGAGQTVVCTSDGDVPANCARFIETANPGNILALTEALEAADRRNAELNSTLECWATDRAQAASDLDDAEKRIAELEARTLTVKLPDGYGPSVQKGGTQSVSYRAIMSVKGPWIHRDMLVEVLAAQGIKLQIEGEE